MAIIEFIDQTEKEEGRGKNKRKYLAHCYLTVRSSISKNSEKSAHVLNLRHLILTNHNCLARKVEMPC